MLNAVIFDFDGVLVDTEIKKFNDIKENYVMKTPESPPDYIKIFSQK